MLAEALPHAFTGSPHEYQQHVVTLTEEMLEGARQEAMRASADLAVQASAAEERCTAAEEACGRAKADVEAKKTISQDRTSAVTEHQKEHTLAEDAKRVVLSKHDDLREKKENIDSVVATLEKYEGGMLEQPPTTEVMAYLQSIGAEKALTAAVPGALALAPAARKDFDVIVMDFVKKTLVGDAATAHAALEAAKPAERDAEVEALGAWAVLDVAKDGASKAAIALSEAQATLAEVTAEREAATKQKSDHLIQQTLAESREQQLKGALGALEALRTRQAEEVAAATAAMEAPAQEAAVAMEVDATAKGTAGDIGEREQMLRVATPMGA